MILSRLFGFFQGLFYSALKRVESDEISISRMEAKLEKAQYNRKQAMTSMATLTVAFERKKNEMEPKVQELEALITQLINNGEMEAAATKTHEFKEVEAQYLSALENFERSEKDLKIQFEQSKLDIEETKNQLRAIKDLSKRVKAESQLNAVRAAASGEGWESADLGADIARIKDRLQEKDDKNKAGRMVLDMGTEGKVEKLQKTKAEKTALDQIELAKFASKRGLKIPTQREGVTHIPVGEVPTENTQKADGEKQNQTV